MSDPVETERRFQDLMIRLAFPASPRQRLLSIVAFLKSPGRNFGQAESYVVELMQQVPPLMLDSEFVGMDPVELNEIHERLCSVVESISRDDTPNGLGPALIHLNRLSALQFAYVGEVQRALNVMGMREHGDLPETLTPEENLSPGGRLQNALAEARKTGHPSFSLLSELLSSWPIPKPEGRSVLVPVVEQPLVQSAFATPSGTLRRVTLRVLGPANDEKDDLHTDVAVFGVDYGNSRPVGMVADAARRVVREMDPGSAGSPMSAQVVFEGHRELYQGDSADLAIGVLACSAMSRFAGDRRQYRLLPTVALTGSLASDGQVLPVDHDGLFQKVRAAFFSPATCLVVPKSHLKQVEEIVSELSGEYPRRHLSLIGVSHLREVFFDRRVVNEIRISLFRHFVSKTWNWRRPIAALMLFSLCLAVFRLTYGPIDKNPVLFEYSGEMLVFKNKSNQQIDEIRVGKRTSAYMDVPLANLLPVALVDINGDGRNEIFWCAFADDGVSSVTDVRCKEIGEEKPLWSFRTQESLVFPQSTDVGNSEFIARRIIVDDFDHDGRFEVLVSAVHNAFPCVLFRLDAHTGKELSHYLHIGHLDDMKIWDVDGDGFKEVILCGVNNAFASACVVVLDGRRIDGISPTAGDDIPDGYSPAMEKAYLRIPRTVLGLLYDRVVKYNLAKSFNIDPERKSFTVHVEDVFGVKGEPQERIEAAFDLILGFDLRPLDITSGDQFDALYEHHLERRDIPDVDRNTYLKGYKNSIERWNNRDLSNKDRR